MTGKQAQCAHNEKLLYSEMQLCGKVGQCCLCVCACVDAVNVSAGILLSRHHVRCSVAPGLMCVLVESVPANVLM